MEKIKAIIVEDSRLARNELKELLKAHPEIEIIGEAENVDDAFALINQLQPQVLFLDINMPEKNGFELLEMLDHVPLTIFTTAYDEYAIKSFEYNAFDYLLKPINQTRFSKTITKVVAQIEQQKEIKQEAFSLDRQIFIKEGERCWLVKIAEISLFEIVGNYTRVYFNENKPLLYKSLQQIEAKLPEATFFRANRQQIINLNHVKEVTPWFNGKLKIALHNIPEEVEISRRQSYKFKEVLGF